MAEGHKTRSTLYFNQGFQKVKSEENWVALNIEVVSESARSIANILQHCTPPIHRYRHETRARSRKLRQKYAIISWRIPEKPRVKTREDHVVADRNTNESAGTPSHPLYLRRPIVSFPEDKRPKIDRAPKSPVQRPHLTTATNKQTMSSRVNRGLSSLASCQLNPRNTLVHATKMASLASNKSRTPFAYQRLVTKGVLTTIRRIRQSPVRQALYSQAGNLANREPRVGSSSVSNRRLVSGASGSQSENTHAHIRGNATPFLETYNYSEFRNMFRSRGGIVVRLLASHQGEPGSIPDGVAPVYSHVGIMPDDGAGRRDFSGICRFLRRCITELLHIHLASALKTSMLRARAGWQSVAGTQEERSPMTHLDSLDCVSPYVLESAGAGFRSCQPLDGSGAPTQRRETAVTEIQAADHDEVSTPEINIRKMSLLLPAYILAGALNVVRPVKLATYDVVSNLRNVGRDTFPRLVAKPYDDPPARLRETAILIALEISIFQVHACSIISDNSSSCSVDR
ncbi:hypothetical protein PR048_000661 [Dryococelus australis]|uniref:Uncharacterized protein n=1 Tax=Dryococelus australis TaxID=614101 RepID=A0ABQ9IF93_9NEOP|nr:hypothetical protein PR048_000661 [Dryococelus australis]